MRPAIVVFLLSLIVAGGCKTSTEPSSSGGTPPAPAGSAVTTSTPAAPQVSSQTSPLQQTAKLDACSLLSSKEIESIQGEPVKETKLTGQTNGGLSLSQCFFTLPTFTNSVSLQVAQKGDGSDAREPKEFWRETFHEKKAGEPEREREEKEESGPPKKVTGIGDEAFWMGSRIGGALYVLKGKSYVRVSVGGPADQANKIRRSKSLAQKVLAKLS